MNTTRLLIYGLLLCAGTFITGCATLSTSDMDATWKMVAKDYTTCHRPAIKIVPGPVTATIAGKRVEVVGFYNATMNMVVLDQDKGTYDFVLEHEYRHACGDRLGEKW